MSSTLDENCQSIVARRPSISVDDLKSLLDSIFDQLKSNENLDDYCKIIDAVKKVRVNTLIERQIISHDVFHWIRNLLISIFHQWQEKSDLLTEKHQYLFREVVDIFSKLISYIKNTNQVPTFSSFQEFLLDQSLFQSLSALLNDLAEGSLKYQNNEDKLKLLNDFIGLIQWYQSDHDEIRNHPHMLLLIDSIIKCLSSSTYIETFKQLNIESSEQTSFQEFFLQRCPCYTVWHRGTAQLTIIHQLCLNGILQSYEEIYDLFLPTIEQWERAVMESVFFLTAILRYVSFYPTTRRYLQKHPRIIDSILILLNATRLVENALITVEFNDQTHLTDSVLSFLFNLTDDLEFLTLVNENPLFTKDTFFKLKQSKIERIQLNSFMILSKILDENDIHQLDNVDTLVAVFMNYLVNASKTPEHAYEDVPIEYLLSSLKGMDICSCLTFLKRSNACVGESDSFTAKAC